MLPVAICIWDNEEYCIENNLVPVTDSLRNKFLSGGDLSDEDIDYPFEMPLDLIVARKLMCLLGMGYVVCGEWRPERIMSEMRKYTTEDLMTKTGISWDDLNEFGKILKEAERRESTIYWTC